MRFKASRCHLQKHRRSDAAGFTLAEIVAVVFILSISSAIIVSRFFFSSTDLIAQTEVIKSHLRYAQARAMNSETVWGIQCDGSAYWLFQNADANNKVLLPGEKSSEPLLADKGIQLASFTLAFDSWGKPYSDAAATQLLAADRTLIVSDGVQQRTITITRNTGFIE